VGHVARKGELRNAYNVLVGKPEEKRSIGKPRRRWKDNIRMDLKEIGGRGWTGCIWLRIGAKWWTLVNTVINLLFL